MGHDSFLPHPSSFMAHRRMQGALFCETLIPHHTTTRCHAVHINILRL